MSLGDFVKQLVGLLCKHEVVIPFEDESPWHELFYELKQAEEVEGKPAFLKSLRFDWDGPYPKSQELSDFLHALHWNASVSAHNPYFDRITLSGEIAKLWLKRYEDVDSETKRFLDKSIEIAKDKFSAERNTKVR